ncbi:O-fucosyltransferase 16-like isoform X2 [Macadamia integrifolia]|uniref:O-fucosyltransferase 16-like isoform X2 n=1 Tax=Macadamia integrifolia TaxID=60698 RepID=UPI001C4EE881|nr:O-fucosyltransferase 16-like isoform X2 [Macadamia integrifolia]
MALSRRRHLLQHQFQYLRCLIPTISIVSATLLILLALLSFLAPAPVDNLSLGRRYLNRFDGGIEVHGSANASGVFRVPMDGGNLGHDLWGSTLSRFYYGCSNASNKFATPDVITEPNRYLLIATSGGLNQQRTGITDAVVAARILNATLVVPKLDQKSFWKDASNFSEIFDVDWFISSLSNDVKVIKQLPRRRGRLWTPYTMRVPRKCTARCYQNRVLPVLLKKHAVQLTKFDYRLANKLDTDLQKLRCRVNYHALKFTDPIYEMGMKLVHRMRMRSRHFITLHLRFEPDMLAFSGCYYGGGEKERKELGAIRRRWKTLHKNNPDKERRHGRCPLTPEEVGLMLRGLGFGSDVHVYVASGEIYGGEETLAPLKAIFPNFHSKDSIASKEELAPFSSFSSRMAALDFIVCDESDVFVTNNNGNMAKILAGRRRYFRHKRTIRPNARKLYSLFLNRANMTWEAFASRVRTHQRGFIGEPKEVRPGRGEFHENPSSCICEDSEAKAKWDRISHSQTKVDQKSGKSNEAIKDFGEVADNQFADDEPDTSDSDYGENQDGPGERGESIGTDLDDDLFLNSEEPELEEMLSD